MYLVKRIIWGLAVGGIVYMVFLLLSEKTRRQPFRKSLLEFLMFCYSGAVVFLTTEYIPFDKIAVSPEAIKQAIAGVNLTPAVSSIKIYNNCKAFGSFAPFITLIGGNIAMLMPLGIFLPLINPRFKLAKIALTAFLVSASIEIFQLIENILLGYNSRAVEIDDLLQNVGGCLLAYCVFSLIRWIVLRIKDKRRIK